MLSLSSIFIGCTYRESANTPLESGRDMTYSNNFVNNNFNLTIVKPIEKKR